jgi:hypothetical protein
MTPREVCYAGIGSRKTPEDVLKLMHAIAVKSAAKGRILRSGGAQGADQAFESGALSANGRIESWNPRLRPVIMHPWAVHECKRHCWEYPLDQMQVFIQSLLVRNMYQILGEDSTHPVSGVILWTPDPDPCSPKSGGTRYAARCARMHGIPIWNLRNPEEREIWEIWVR